MVLLTLVNFHAIISFVKERYQPKAEEAKGSAWDSLTEMPDFVAREVGPVVEEALAERDKHGITIERDNLAETQELVCDIVDQNWMPTLDAYYKDRLKKLTKAEWYERNRLDLDWLNGYLQLAPEAREQFLETHEEILQQQQADIRQYRDHAERLGISASEIMGYDQLYEDTYDNRRRLQLLRNPEQEQKSLISEQIQLGRELAQDHPLYHDAIEGMDPAIIDQNVNAIINSVPPRAFDHLAKLIRRPKKRETFYQEVQDVLVRALNLEGVNIETQMFVDDPSKQEGFCTVQQDGYLVGINAVATDQNPWAYARILAHELYHVLQNRVQKAGDTELADLYDFNVEHYGRPDDVGYSPYRNQLIEAEAFHFMDRFLGEIQKADLRNRNTLSGRIKHWWIERGTKKMPDDLVSSLTSPAPLSNRAIMLQTNTESPDEPAKNS